MSKILIIADDDIGPAMAGPGMRFVTFASLLARQGEVTMAVPHPISWQPEDWQLVPYTRYGDEIEQLVEANEVIICKGLAQFHFPALQRPDRILVCDLYDPFMFENLEAHHGSTDGEAAYEYQFNLDLVLEQLRHGDFFICANERQRDLWVGMLTALGRVNHATYAADHTLRALIDVVPFGLSADPPQHITPVIKGVWPGVTMTDKVVLWGGGVWSWLDPKTPLRAMAILADEHPEIKLCFLGKARPATSWYASSATFDQMQAGVEGLAHELGVLGRNVFFNDHWVEVNDRGAYLLEADVGIIGHTLNLETHYSARTRALDYLWAGLPIVTTEGDTVAEWVARYGLGIVVPPEDPAAFAQGLIAALTEPRMEIAARMAPLVASLTWEHAVAPLLRFCADPHSAPDHRSESMMVVQQSLDKSVTHRDGVIRDLEAAIQARDHEIDERKVWLAHLEHALVERDREIDERKAWLAHLEHALVERDREIDERKAWSAQLEQGIAHREGVIAQLQADVDWAKTTMTNLQHALAASEARIAVLEGRFGLVNRTLDRVADLAARLRHR